MCPNNNYHDINDFISENDQDSIMGIEANGDDSEVGVAKLDRKINNLPKDFEETLFQIHKEECGNWVKVTREFNQAIGDSYSQEQVK